MTNHDKLYIEENEENQDYKENKEPLEDPARGKINEMIGKSVNGKLSDKDGINAERFIYVEQKLREHLYQLIERLWKKEKMPQFLGCGQIITIQKKEVQKICK